MAQTALFSQAKTLAGSTARLYPLMEGLPFVVGGLVGGNGRELVRRSTRGKGPGFQRLNPV